MLGIGVVGAGAWGTALAFQLARSNPELPIYLWGYNPAQQKQLQQERCNKSCFPNHPFPANLLPVVEITEMLPAIAGMVIVVPSHAFTELVKNLFNKYAFSLPILSATKGLDPVSAELLYKVIHQYGGESYPFSVLSGPSFATEVMAQLPTAITIAAVKKEQAVWWQNYFHSDYFRAYTTEDIIGVQLGGAVKNVLAIATGVSDGLGFGANARAALITRGLAEMLRLNKELGGERNTLMGLAGLGDLVLTCTDSQSRNRRFGIALGEGKTPAQAQKEQHQVIEGYQTAKLLQQLLQHHKIEMPICTAIYKLLYEHLPVRQVIQDLLGRTAKAEH
jgi:glycerol-3-phosphate dehydrogenase (NAD(P)+)